MCVRIVRQRLEECIIDLLSQQSMGTDGAQIQPYGSGVEEGGGQEATGFVIYYSCFCDDRAGLPPAARGGQHGMLEIPNYAKVTYPYPQFSVCVSVYVCVNLSLCMHVVCVCVCVCVSMCVRVLLPTLSISSLAKA